METKARRITALMAGLLLLVPIVALGDTATIELACGTWPLVSVRVDGEGPFTFLLDTGTTRTLIDEELAQSLGKKALGETSVRTPSGVSRASLVRVDRLELAGRESMVVALVAKVDRVHALPTIVAGIVGLDFLSQYNFQIDYERRELGLYDEGAEHPVEGGARVDARLERGRLLLRGIAAEHESVWLALDTGAHRLVVYDDEGRPAEFVERDRYQRRKLASTGGVRIVSEARIEHLALGALELHDVPATLLAYRTTTPEEGLLPGNLFQSVFVDCERGLAVLNGRTP